MSFRIVYSDHLFESLDFERRMFEVIDGEPIDGEATDEPLRKLVGDADALVVMYHPVDADLMDLMPKCRVINRSGIGVDNIDLDAATERGIYVTNIPDYCIQEVSDHAMAMILALQRKIVFYNSHMKGGNRNPNDGWIMHRVENQTLGLVGFGNIARAVCGKAPAFGMKVIAYDPYLTHGQIQRGGAEPVNNLDELLMNSDVVSVHTPLTLDTRGLIGARELSMMKETAFIINVARGGIIDEEALLVALDEGRIVGAGLDVFASEPIDPGDPLVGHERVICTPHIAWNSVESEAERRRKSAEEVIQALQGKVPRYLINKDILEGK